MHSNSRTLLTTLSEIEPLPVMETISFCCVPPQILSISMPKKGQWHEVKLTRIVGRRQKLGRACGPQLRDGRSGTKGDSPNRLISATAVEEEKPMAVKLMTAIQQIGLCISQEFDTPFHLTGEEPKYGHEQGLHSLQIR